MTRRSFSQPRAMAGFTLIEAIMVIVITGIIAGMVAIFIARPVEGYVASVRRADLTDAADTALRRVARDIRAALPNSLRTSTTDQCIEFLPVVAGGRYATVTGDTLDFINADTSFNVYGYAPSNTATPSVGQSLVVYNLGIPGADAYDSPAANSSRALVATDSSSTNIKFDSKKFPLESPGRRFQLLATDSNRSYSVVYACVGAGTDAQGNGSGAVYRYTRSLLDTTKLEPLSACPTAQPASSTVLVQNVATCSFAYTPAVNRRNGQLTMLLRLQQAGESVQLYHEVHVNNVP